MNSLTYVEGRMEVIQPRYNELSSADKLTDEERAEYERVAAEWDELEERRADLVSRRERAAAASSVNFNVNRNPDPHAVDLRGATPVEVIQRGREAVTAATNRFARAEHAENVMRLLDRDDKVAECVARLAISTGSAEYRRAWAAAMTGGPIDPMLERANAEYRAMTAGTGSSGGYMVPLYLDPTMIITGTGSYNPIRQVANVKQITTLTWNGASAAQVTAAWTAENAAAPDNTPTVSPIVIPTNKGVGFVPASFEAFEDITALASDVGMLLSDAKDNLEATAFATGAGTTEPKGVITAVTAITASRVSPTTGGAYVAADVYKVHQALPPRHRYANPAQRAWVMSLAFIDATRQFGTTYNHAFLDDLTAGQPPRLLGDQLLEASAMSAVVTTGNNVVLYGDFSKYLVIDRVGASVEFVPNIFNSSGIPTGTRAWLMHWRTGADVADVNAFRLLKL